MRLSLVLGIVFFVIAAAVQYLSSGAEMAIFGRTATILVSARVGSYVGLAVGTSVYAILAGGAPERWAGVVMLTTLAAHPVLHLIVPVTFSAVDPVHLLIDLVRFVAFMAIARRANRFWVICFAAFQLLAIAAHLVKVMQWDVHPVAYQVGNVIWTYGMLALLILATRHHRRLLSRGVTRKSWSDFSRRSGPMRSDTPVA